MRQPDHVRLFFLLRECVGFATFIIYQITTYMIKAKMRDTLHRSNLTYSGVVAIKVLGREE